MQLCVIDPTLDWDHRVESGSMWLVNCQLVDVREGVVHPNSGVEILDGRIVNVRLECPEWVHPGGGSGDVLDLGGRYLMPGMISVHTHLSVVYPFDATDESENPGLTVLRSLGRAREALNAGVTTLRTLHEQNRADLLLRQAAKEGWIRIPRIFASGRALSTTGGHGRDLDCSYADGADGFLAAARAELAAGADHLKIFITGGIAHLGEQFDCAQMTAEEMRAVTRAAEEHGTYVTAHAGSSGAIREAMDAGVRCFQHGYSLDEETAAEMARRGVYLTPTLSVTRCPEWMADHNFTEWQIELAVRTGEGHLASIKNAVRAGVTMLNGTDYPPGEPIDGTVVAVREMEFMVEAGLSSTEALRTVTTNPAALLGVSDEIGAVEPGYVADLIVIDSDPTADVSNMRQISMVIQAGELIRDDRGQAGGNP